MDLDFIFFPSFFILFSYFPFISLFPNAQWQHFCMQICHLLYSSFQSSNIFPLSTWSEKKRKNVLVSIRRERTGESYCGWGKHSDQSCKYLLAFVSFSSFILADNLSDIIQWEVSMSDLANTVGSILPIQPVNRALIPSIILFKTFIKLHPIASWAWDLVIKGDCSSVWAKRHLSFCSKNRREKGMK